MLRLFLIIIVLLFNPISIHAADIEKKLTDSNYNLVLSENFSKKFKSNEAWKKDRKSKIENKKNIEIKISDIKVISFDNKNALVQFTQSYNSDSFSDVVKKHIIISTISRNYKITGEFILK